jgi:septal ring factor EnvC (AmiA/AmiB activator)
MAMLTKRFFILGCIMLISIFVIGQDRYQDLKTKIDSIRIDSTTFGEVYGAQLDEIVLDYKQINDALKIKIDSLNGAIQSLKETDLASKSKSSFMFYALIGAGALLLVFLILFIVFMLKSSKKNKLLKQANLELGKLKAEIEQLNKYIGSEKEQHQYSLELIESEKEKVISQLKKLTSEFETYKMQTSAKEEELNKKLEEINNSNIRLQQEYEVLKKELDLQLAKNEEAALTINELKDEIQQKTSSVYNAEQEISMIRQNYNSLAAKINELQKENELLKQQINEANETKEKVNSELKKFVEELQTMLPLPKK